MNVKSHLNKETVINSIRLQLRHPSGEGKVWIVVEGETDIQLFSKLINGNCVKLEIAHGGVNSLLDIVSALLKETKFILGIRDADFLHLESKKVTSRNIFLTDFHDMEMMIISCDKAYYQVSAEYLSSKKDHLLLRENILKSIAFIGGFRWINDSDSLEFNFKGLSFENFYNKKNLTLNKEKCLNEVTNRSPNKKKVVTVAEIDAKVQNVLDFLNLCNGHDFLKASALHISCYSKKGVGEETLGKGFRIAYRFEDFQKTDLYQQLESWAKAQSKILFKL